MTTTTTTTMSTEAKRALSTTIRALRGRLLEDLHAATESTYRLGVTRVQEAGLPEAARAKRLRLDTWINEQHRAQAAGAGKGTARRDADFRREAEAMAAYTLLNRLVILRLLEAPGPGGTPLRSPALVSGGWGSRAYLDFRQLAPALVRGDATEGYAFLLGLVFEDLAGELPGLFGPVGVADLIPIPPATLRHIIEELDKPALASCWTDDMTLGWVYQYWNDPAREALDAKLNGGGKLAPHEIASKTQMFTERYMVDWLLQNSLGPLWLAICARNGWTAEVESDGTLARLEERRTAWRAQRAAGTVALTELMPLHNDQERRWAYYLPQPLPDDAVAQAPASVRDLKILDPALGSGHFLVVALALLVALYREEARQRGLVGQPGWGDRAIVERILGYNLHGIDLDPRAVQIAAAALWLKARQIAPDAHPERLNLVASNLRLAGLADDDPALVELRGSVEATTGMPGRLTDQLINALRGADHLGSLLKVSRAVEEALDQTEGLLGASQPQQALLFGEEPAAAPAQPLSRAAAQATLLDRLESFLAHQTHGDDLGLRLRGEQLAAGVRFVRLVREVQYDLVVANPPYQGTSSLADAKYIETQYRLGKADLYAAFLLRGLELVRDGGISAMLTMRNWMFIKQYSDLRQHLLEQYNLRGLHDLSSGAFEEISAAQVVVSVVTSIFQKIETGTSAVAIKAFDDATVTQVGETTRKRAATLCHVGRHAFDPAALQVVPEWPLVYWWDEPTLLSFRSAPPIEQVCPPKVGLQTGDNSRFVRSTWEPCVQELSLGQPEENIKWCSLIKGAEGKVWFEPCRYAIEWKYSGLAVRLHTGAVIRNSEYYFKLGVSYTTIGNGFSGRAHRIPSVIMDMGSSVYPQHQSDALVLFNSSFAKFVLESLNPTVHFTSGDVARLPALSSNESETLFYKLDDAFTIHESHREPSVEFKQPGPSPWRHAQAWAQTAVDRPAGAPLPAYVEELDPEPPSDHLSFALGVALGRFGAQGAGILDPTTDDLTDALPAGILLLDGTLDASDRRDSLGHPAAAGLHTAWATHGPALGSKRGDLRTWLALDFFKDVHKGMYENRPIHWPLTSANKSFVAWVTIHRFSDRTLRILLADHLYPAANRLDGTLTDLRTARDGADKGAARAAERQYARVLKARDELNAFIALVEQCDDRGAPPTDSSSAKCPPREQPARYAPNLDDGVMINAAALWPLLDPQWKEPKKWWKELATAQGRKDYDWAHLALRYWPTRVDQKCQADPSLAVAHGCFWRYHPARAWAWELRLQDEIGPNFRITEAPYRPGGRDLGDSGDGPHRREWLRAHPDDAIAAIEKEALRRLGRGKDRTAVPTMSILEPGLWSARPRALWALELRLAEKQGSDFRLLAPDEAAARAALIAAEPGLATARAEFLAGLVPLVGLFDDEDDTSAEDEDEGYREEAEAEDEDETDDA